MTGNALEDLPSLELFRDRIKFALDRANMSQSELARIIGTTPQNVQNMTTRDKPTYRGSRLLEISEALRVPAGWLACNDTGTAHQTPTGRKAMKGEAHMASLGTAGLSALQIAGLEALVTLMRSGDYSDEEVIDLLGELKPRLARRKSE